MRLTIYQIQICTIIDIRIIFGTLSQNRVLNQMECRKYRYQYFAV